MSALFISYRRTESGHARGLFSSLKEILGKDGVFLDVDGIPPGSTFFSVLKKKLTECRVVIALIGHHWPVDRLANEDDMVRLEPVTALSRNITVIPVLIDGRTMPTEAELPEDLAELAGLQAYDLRTQQLRERH